MLEQAIPPALRRSARGLRAGASRWRGARRNHVDERRRRAPASRSATFATSPPSRKTTGWATGISETLTADLSAARRPHGDSARPRARDRARRSQQQTGEAGERLLLRAGRELRRAVGARRRASSGRRRRARHRVAHRCLERAGRPDGQGRRPAGRNLRAPGSTRARARRCLARGDSRRPARAAQETGSRRGVRGVLARASSICAPRRTSRWIGR